MAKETISAKDNSKDFPEFIKTRVVPLESVINNDFFGGNRNTPNMNLRDSLFDRIADKCALNYGQVKYLKSLFNEEACQNEAVFLQSLCDKAAELEKFDPQNLATYKLVTYTLKGFYQKKLEASEILQNGHHNSKTTKDSKDVHTSLNALPKIKEMILASLRKSWQEKPETILKTIRGQNSLKTEGAEQRLLREQEIKPYITAYKDTSWTRRLLAVLTVVSASASILLPMAGLAPAVTILGSSLALPVGILFLGFASWKHSTDKIGYNEDTICKMIMRDHQKILAVRDLQNNPSLQPIIREALSLDPKSKASPPNLEVVANPRKAPPPPPRVVGAAVAR